MNISSSLRGLLSGYICCVGSCKPHRSRAGRSVALDIRCPNRKCASSCSKSFRSSSGSSSWIIGRKSASLLLRLLQGLGRCVVFLRIRIRIRPLQQRQQYRWPRRQIHIRSDIITRPRHRDQHHPHRILSLHRHRRRSYIDRHLPPSRTQQPDP